MPTSNPLIAQGTLNRLRASVTITGSPELNVTAPYLGEAGLSMALEGESVTYIPTMAGQVTSPEPYLAVSVTMNILKTQGLAAIYKARMESNALIGDFTVIPDAATLPPYQILNGSIANVREITMSGKDAGFAVTLKGYYTINNNQWAG